MLEANSNKIIIGGEFTTYDNSPVKKIIRLKVDSNMDADFNIGSGTTDIVPYNSNCYFCFNNVKVFKQQTDGKIIVGGRFLTFNGLSATNITRIFGSNGFQARSTSQLFESEPEIDVNPNSNKVTIYPNPSNGIFNVDLIQMENACSLVVYNLLGSIVLEKRLNPKETTEFDISHLSSGFYTARIIGENIDENFKLIKN